MSFCEHCEGQRFDRAQVLRVLRRTRRGLLRQQQVTKAEDVMALVINAVRTLEVPHLELVDDQDLTDEVIH